MKNEQRNQGFFKNIIETKIGLIVLLFLAMILIFNDLSKPGLPSFDDCTKAQRAWEMLKGGDWITPHYAGEPNFDHPPFYFWMLAGSFALLGKVEFAARFFGALCAFFTVLVAYKLGHTVKSRSVGWFAAFFLSTSYMFLKLSRRVATDVPFMLFASLALYFFIRIYQESSNPVALPSSKKLRVYSLFFGVSVGISGLIKSVFVIFPLLTPLVFLVFRKEIKSRAARYYYPGAALGAILAGWWYVYEYIKYGSRFIDEFVGQFLIGHAGGMSDLGEFGPLGYFYEFLRHFWLWLPLTVYAFWFIGKKRLLKELPSMKIITVHLIFPFIILSLFGDKSIRYAMFLFIPTLILTSFAVIVVVKNRTGNYAKYAVIFLASICVYMIAKPIDMNNIPNHDYIILRDLIEDGTVKVKGRYFYHYGGGYAENRQPMLFYTGYDLKGIVDEELGMDTLLKNKQRFFLLIPKAEYRKNFRRDFIIKAYLETRYVLISKKYLAKNQ